VEVANRQIKKATGIKLSDNEKVGSQDSKFVQEEKVGEKASPLGNLKMIRSRPRSKTKRNTLAEREILGGYNDRRDDRHNIPENSQ